MTKRANYAPGMVVNAVSAKYDRAVTAPPDHYTEALLLDDMIAAHKFAQTPQDREILKSISGIGTSRTRDVIIKGLVDRGFLEKTRAGRSGKKYILKATPAARALLAGLPDIAKSAALSAKWELALGMVADGKATADQLGAKIDQSLTGLVQSLLNRSQTHQTGAK